MKTKLQEIKNKIYKLKHSTDSIEEAMEKELVFGAYINGMGYHYARVCLVGAKFITLNKGDYCITKEKKSDIIKNCEILGTNISLADVLMAIKKSGEYFCLMPSDDNNVDFLKVVEDGYEYLAEWDTSNDSLDWHAEHKPELITFLHSIICK